MEKKLYRSTTNKVVGGVCGGLGEYFDIDPVFLRIVAVILALTHGFGILAYIVAWIIMPKGSERPIGAPGAEPTEPTKPVRYSSWNKYLPGLILIGLGVILLVQEHWYWVDWEEYWPVALVIVGLYLIFRRGKRDNLEHTQATENHEPKPENGGSIA